MTDDERWEAVLRQIATQTDAGEIRWQKAPDLKSRCTEGTGIVGVPYTARIRDKIFLVYEYEFRYYTDSDEWSPATEVAVDLISSDGELEFGLPRVGGRWQLMNAIRGQVSGARDFLRDFLSGEPGH